MLLNLLLRTYIIKILVGWLVGGFVFKAHKPL